jgi:hypothetical protein
MTIHYLRKYIYFILYITKASLILQNTHISYYTTPNNLQVLLIGEHASGVVIIVVIVAAVGGVVVDGLHRLGGGVTIVGASVLLKQFHVLKVQGEWFIVPGFRCQLWLIIIAIVVAFVVAIKVGVIIAVAIVAIIVHLLPLWRRQRGGGRPCWSSLSKGHFMRVEVMEVVVIIEEGVFLFQVINCGEEKQLA